MNEVSRITLTNGGPYTPPTPPKVELQETQTGAEQLIKASCAAIDQVHDYALKELLRLEELIARTKLSIEEKKNRSTAETRVYVESVDNALRAAQAIEEAVKRIDAGNT